MRRYAILWSSPVKIKRPVRPPDAPKFDTIPAGGETGSITRTTLRMRAREPIQTAIWQIWVVVYRRLGGESATRQICALRARLHLLSKFTGRIAQPADRKSAAALAPCRLQQAPSARQAARSAVNPAESEKGAERPKILDELPWWRRKGAGTVRPPHFPSPPGKEGTQPRQVVRSGGAIFLRVRLFGANGAAGRYQPITMFDSITLRAISRSEPVSCI
jgi:hypothetical protein